MLPWGILALTVWMLDVSSSQQTAKVCCYRKDFNMRDKGLEEIVIYKGVPQSIYNQTLVRHQELHLHSGF